jgi:hypothetical protein
MEKGKIQFKPLHEGMGFHPFSDGLPYAPESKSKYANGAGANAAGRPQFATPTTSGPALAPATSSSPKLTARQLQERQNGIQNQAAIQHQPLTKMPITPHDPATVRAKNQPDKKNTGNTQVKADAAKAMGAAQASAITNDSSILRKRAFAYLMDTVIHAGFWLATNLAALFFFKFQLDSDIVRENLGQFVVFFLISQWMFIALQEILFENSIGKVFFNLEFKRSHKSLFIRSLVFMLSALFFGLGFFFRPQDKFGEIQLKSQLYA